MVVPYAKTIFPHHRKHAFDTGEYGIGALANSLALGCDCLGSITYLDAEFVTRAGGIETIKSAICIQYVVGCSCSNSRVLTSSQRGGRGYPAQAHRLPRHASPRRP
jgi:hypothetical protein